MDGVTPLLVTVGTTHPLNVAGAGLDIAVARSLEVRPLTIVAGVSAQTAHAVLHRTPLDEATIAAQFRSLAGLTVGAFHIGALLDAASVAAVARELASFDETPVVCDPVIAAGGGDRLANDATVAALRAALFPCCTLVTPNLDEASLLLGAPVRDLAAMHAAARALLRFGSHAVLLKGGHLEGDAVDVFATRTEIGEFRSARIDAELRGTGDLLACAIAASLAHGRTLPDAIERARSFVRDQIAGGVSFAQMRVTP